MKTLVAFQKEDGLVEGAYPDGNWLRTVLLYTFWKTQGVWLENWEPGVRLGAARAGDALHVTLESDKPWTGRLHFDFARHRRTLNFDRNYVRLNEWPEWFPVDENAFYDVTDGSGRTETLLGSDLKHGLSAAAPGRWVVRKSGGR
jgi:hypothetical protein